MQQIAARKPSLDDKYLQKEGRVFLTGTQALVRLTIMQRDKDFAAGLNTAGFVSGYRGSPLGGLDKELWSIEPFLLEKHIHFQPGVNEELAATALWGSQQVTLFPGATYDGVFGLWYGKGPGVDRSGDVFKHANSAGTSARGGVLVVAGDDHGCKSSTLAHQSEYGFMDAMIPVLNPAGVQEIIDFGLHGWAMSRFSGCWVGLKVLADTADASYSTDINPERVRIKLPVGVFGDLNIRLPDTPLEQDFRLHAAKLEAALAYARVNNLNRITHDSPNARFGIITTGNSWSDLLKALDDLNIDELKAGQIGLRILKIGMSWPLDSEIVIDFARGLDEVLVVEEKRDLIEGQLTSHLYKWQNKVKPVVVGKKDEHGKGLLPSAGALTSAMIARVVAARISRFYSSDSIRDRLNFLKDTEARLLSPRQKLERTPHYCSGCPHNTSTVVPEGSRALGGIGCHYMVTWMDRNTDTFSQMGGEGAAWIGQSRFTTTKHVFQNLGDGTYFHSGILAIRAAISAKVNITYKILFNDAVAMTGGQPIDGTLSVEQICTQLSGEGVSKIVVVSDEPGKYKSRTLPGLTSVTHRDNLDKLQRELRECTGTSILIYDQTCAAEKRRRRKKKLMIDPAVRPFINSMVCEGCGDCGITSNCLSIAPEESTYGRKRQIDQSSCNKDMSCIKGFCPSFVSVLGGNLKKPVATETNADAIELPAPVLPDIRKPYGIVLAGVGGTGVTTLGAILGMAAHLEGKGATVLDMTGLAQKFGAVTSHIQIAKDQKSIHASRIPAGGARVLIGCDLVVAAGDESIAKLNPASASAVVNRHRSMTAEFTQNANAQFPQESMEGLIRESAGPDNAWFVDASEIVEKLLGNTMSTNFFLLGFAWQKGLVPISEVAIDQAIELNKVSVATNRRAFTLGRRMAHDPVSFSDLLPKPRVAPILDTLEALISDRKRFLTNYQNVGYALRYEKLVDEVAGCDDSDGKLLTSVVARYYFKVLAYKDEYEVARLYSTKEFKDSLKEQFEGNFRLRFHLAPPLLAPRDPVSGLPCKMNFGGWVMHIFSVLAKLRFLRGTAFDPFALTKDRKLERELIKEYEDLVNAVLARLKQQDDNTDMATFVQILSMPEQVRGYGHIKQRSVELARAELNKLWRRLETRETEATIPLVHISEISVFGK